MLVSRRPLTLILALVALCAIALPAGASAAKKKSKLPEITRVTPMRIVVGAKLTIRGKNFKSKKRQNTIVFRASNGRSAFAKPTSASRKKLVVKVPVALKKIVGQKSMRFKIRVLAGKFSKYTPKRLSPVVVGSSQSITGGGPGSQSSCVAGDYDRDLLGGQTELAIGTDPCLKDTDLDAVNDGYEEQSAIDLNHYPSTPPLPYPGKRPYPNALDPSDAGTDYDGDGLTLRDEFVLWTRYLDDGVRRTGSPSTLSNLLYSDGLQASRVLPAPGGGLLRWALDQDGDSTLGDDERDADTDGLGNWDEAHGRMSEGWWPAIHNGDPEPQESAYPGINFFDNADLSSHDAMGDPDIDGDGVLDGADDTDHDGLTNQFEVSRPGDWLTDAFVDAVNEDFTTGANPWAYTNPFNPCKPFASDRCHEHPPIGYYDSDEVPYQGPTPPAGFPGTHPATPDG
jgi:hypothetical protein